MELSVTQLTDRYLHAVKFWLPRNQKDDIIAELSEDLYAQIEEKQSELGRPLDSLEAELILKRCGSPMLVAQRYMPQRSLIGPALFPIYSKVIRALFLYFLLPWLLLWIGISILSPDFRADHPGLGLFASLEPWWIACTHALFFNTLAFALLDRSQARSQLVNGWSPRSLPAVNDRIRISRSSTLFELTVAVATLVLWLQIGIPHRTFHIFGLDLTLSPGWPHFFWALTLLSLSGIAVSCLNLVQSQWTRLSASLRLGIDCYSWALFFWLCRSNMLQFLSGGDVSVEKSSALVRSINSWVFLSAYWVAGIGLIVLAFDLRRILRATRPV
jgi:hypothetical protein